MGNKRRKIRGNKALDVLGGQNKELVLTMGGSHGQSADWP